MGRHGAISWLGVGWVGSGVIFNDLMGFIHCLCCNWLNPTHSHTCCVINSQHVLPLAMKLSQVPNSSAGLQCGCHNSVSSMSSGAENEPYVFDWKSVVKANKLRPVHYSLAKLKKIRSGLAEAVT